MSPEQRHCYSIEIKSTCQALRQCAIITIQKETKNGNAI
jgi:hypothetical protein